MALRFATLEPLRAQGIAVDPQRLERLCARLELDPSMLDRRPHQLSIGQVQKVGILRALIASLDLVLFDEPLSALDAVTQKHTAQLITELQRDEGFAVLIVTHDMGYAAAHANDIVILRNGRVEEIASLGAAMPAYWLGLLLIVLFAVHLAWLPAMGAMGACTVAHLVMPALTLVWLVMAGLFGGIAHIPMTLAFRYAEASQLAPSPVSCHYLTCACRSPDLSFAAVNRLPVCLAAGAHWCSACGYGEPKANGNIRLISSNA